MSETKTNQAWRGVPEEEAVRRLLEGAGPRSPLPEDDLASIKEAARGQWRKLYSDRSVPARLVRWWIPLAAAALLAVVGLVWWARNQDRSPVSVPTVASIERLKGLALLEASAENPVQLLGDAVGRPLPAGSKIATGEASETSGRVALRMAGGASVRLDAGTRVRVASATVVELERGAVYVDTGAEPGRREEVAVSTPAGLFLGIGTQFEVRAGEGGTQTRLRVREGRVKLERAADSVLADAGQELTVQGDGSLVRRRIVAWGPEWDWVLKTAPMLDIEGVKVKTFLDWIAREAGWRIELADEKTATLCDSTVLHGSIDHLTPAEAPGVVLSSCGLGHRVSEGALVVFVAEKEGG